jgi:hypothetical protein
MFPNQAAGRDLAEIGGNEAENGNGARRRITLPCNVAAKDVESLRKVVHEASGLVDSAQNYFEASQSTEITSPASPESTA